MPPTIVASWPLHENASAFIAAAAAWGIMSALFIPTLRLYDRSPFLSLALPLAGFLYALMTLASALRYWRGRGGEWKGRHYQSLVTKG